MTKDLSESMHDKRISSGVEYGKEGRVDSLDWFIIPGENGGEHDKEGVCNLGDGMIVLDDSICEPALIFF
jgi:hypothetical protein